MRKRRKTRREKTAELLRPDPAVVSEVLATPGLSPAARAYLRLDASETDLPLKERFVRVRELRLRMGEEEWADAQVLVGRIRASRPGTKNADGCALPVGMTFAYLPVGLYCACLYWAGRRFGGAELLHMLFVWLHAVVNGALLFYRLRGRRVKVAELHGWSRWVLPPLNVGFAAFAAGELAADLRAGRNPVPAVALAAWTLVPLAVRLGLILRRSRRT